LTLVADRKHAEKARPVDSLELDAVAADLSTAVLGKARSGCYKDCRSGSVFAPAFVASAAVYAAVVLVVAVASEAPFDDRSSVSVALLAAAEQNCVHAF
jgi:Mrp family chromosome partitioning ATPase